MKLVAADPRRIGLAGQLVLSSLRMERLSTILSYRSVTVTTAGIVNDGPVETAR